MAQFINIDDYDASVHHEILDALTRDDDAIAEICEDRAISEMKSYMSGRYDVDRLFSMMGADRHPLVLMFALDITIFHLFCIHNPQKLSQIRKDRYDRALEWLKSIAAGKIDLSMSSDGHGLMTDFKITDEETVNHRTNFLMRSNTKRTNHY